MRAVQIRSVDGPDAVDVVEVPRPDAGPDEVLVDVAAAGLAYPELLQTRGQYQIKPDLPFVPGSEFAGVVRSAPAGAGVSAGDRVAGLTIETGGAWAEVVAVRADRVFPLPDGVPLLAAAGLLFNDLTVHFALVERGRLQTDETVLVHGAAGGIGTSAIRMARALGAGRIIAVVSSPAKQEVATAAGATDTVLAEDWLSSVVDLLGSRGVGLVLDPVGADRVTDSLRSLADGGRLLVVGFAGGDIPRVKTNRLLLNNIDAVGVGWGAWVVRHTGYLQQQWKHVRTLIETGRLTVPQPTVFPLDAAAAALRLLDRRAATGKVVLAVGKEVGNRAEQ